MRRRRKRAVVHTMVTCGYALALLADHSGLPALAAGLGFGSNFLWLWLE